MGLPERGNSNKLTPGRLLTESEACGRIQSRYSKGGDPKESEWPPRYEYGEQSNKGGVWHVDRDSGEIVEGYPRGRKLSDSNAPYVITDNIEPYYHPGVERWTDSKSKLRHMDKDSGCITTDKMQPADPTSWNARQRAVENDAHEALHKAVAHIDQGLAPISEQTQAMCDAKNEVVSRALGIDAFNMVGRKKNAKGKRFKRVGINK